MQKKTTLTRLRLFFGKMLPLLVLLSFSLSKIIAQPYVNGTLSTGTTTVSGVTSPAGYTWSECQNPTGNTTVANTVAGAGAQIAANNSVADDFIVPSGVGWAINRITVYGYSTGAAATPSPYTDIRIRIHRGVPGAPGTTIVFGDLTTNRFTASNDALMYRIFNTVVPPVSAPGTTRKIWTIEAAITVTLGPGTYWLEYQIGSPANGSNFAPLSTPIGVRTLPGYNAMQSLAGGPFNPLMDAGQGTAPTAVATDMPFKVDYSIVAAPPCSAITGSNIFAPNIIWSESFDAVIPAVGWPIQNNSSPLGVITWNQGGPVGVFAPHSGAGFASVNFNSGGGLATINNWMLSPSVTLKNGDQFKFWTRASTGGGVFPDRLQVRMSTNGTSTNVGTLATDVGDFTTLLLDINPTYSTTGYPEVWTQYTVTVSGVPAAGVPGRMAFRYFVENGGPAGANSNYIGIDDAQYISSGSPTICSGGVGNIAVTITGGIGPYTVTYNAAPGGNTTITNYNSGANIAVSPTVNTTYTLVSVVGFDGCVGTNNTGSATINTITGSTAAVLSQVLLPPVPALILNQGFDVVAPLPAGWAAQNLSLPVGPTGWFQGNSGVFPSHSGAATSYIAANFNNTSALATISNWLFVPAAPTIPLLKNGDVFSFWTRTTTGTFPDRLQVWMNTTNQGVNVGATNTSTGDYTTLLLDINPTYTATGYPTAWTQFNITLSGLPAGGLAGRLAFRYFVEGGGPPGANSDYIGIDDVTYLTTVPASPPTTCTGSTANLKVDITGGSSPYTVVINRTPGGLLPPITNYVSGAYIPVTPPVTTTYNIVSVTSSLGCLGTGNSGTPTVTVSATPVTPISISDNPTGPLCAGDPKLLTVVGAGGTFTFTNPGAITIASSVPATPSPANLVVSGLPTSGVTVQSVTINNFSHTWTGDVNMVLQHPTNAAQNVILKGDSQADPSGNTVGATLTFTDAAAISLPTGALVTGNYKPTNRNGSPFAFLAPGPTVTGPTFPASPTLATFTGDFNGTWKLFVEDRVGGDVGQIAGGYSMVFSSPPAPPPVGWSFLWTPASGLSSTTSNPVAASPMTTTTYTVMGTAPSGCQTTAAITIVVNDRPAVTAQPSNVTACVGSTVTFTSAGTGTAITYQWQVSTNGGGTYTNIAAGAPYSGVTTPTLTINPVSITMNTYRYRCVISGVCPPAANSNGAILTVNNLPVISITPAGPVCGGVPGISGTLLSTGSLAPPIPGSLTVNSGTIAVAIPDGPATWPQTLFPGVSTNMAVAGIPANATITGMSVKLNLTHTYIADMVIVLKAPNGAVLNLDANINKTGGAGANFVNTTISSTSSTPLSAGLPPYTGNFQPDAVGATYVAVGFTFPGGPTTPAGYIPTVSNFNGLYSTPNGTWSLGIYDWGAGDIGTLTNWEIKIDYTTPGGTGSPLTFTWSPAAGLYTNATATTPYVAGSQTSNVYAAPTVNTIYTATGTDGTTGCSNTGTVSVIYTPSAPVVSPAAPAICVGSVQTLTVSSSPSLGIWTPNGPTGSLYTDAAATTFYTGTPTTTVYAKPGVTTTYNVSVTSVGPDSLKTFTNAAPVTINNVGTGTPYPSNLVVSGLPVTGTSVKQVILTGISHTWSDDIDILLQSPTGQNVILMSDVGNANLITNATYTFDDAGGPLAAGPTGTYHPTNNVGTIGVEPDNWPAPGPGSFAQTTPALANFGNTANVNGSWKLFVVDDAAGDAGSISGGYSIVFSYPTTGCTSPTRAVTVTVNNPAVITGQPVSTSVCTDKVTSFSVTATGTALTYQWQVSSDNGNTFTNITNGGVYSGATTATLVITAPPTSMNGYAYRVIVQGALPCPAATSLFRILTVNPLPTVVISASLTRLRPGLTSTISSTVTPFAAATGGYSWLRNGTALTSTSPGVVSGLGTSSITVNVDGMGAYTLRVTDVNGCTNTSNTVTIADSTSGKCFIYPNPNSGLFQVRYFSALNNVLPRTVVVYDAKGDQVLVKTYTIGRPYDRMDVDLRKNGKGLYWVEVADANGNRLTMCRVVVQ